MTVSKAAVLFDTIIADRGYKNDAELARVLSVAPPVISKVRAGKMNVGATLILRIHETLEYPVKDIRSMIAAS